MTHAVEDTTTHPEGAGSEDGDEPQRLAGSSSEGPSSSRENPGQKGFGNQGGHRKRTHSEDASGHAHHLRERHQSRVPVLADVERLEADLLIAFKEGQPSEVWEKTQELISLTKEVLKQSARDRFILNFGTEVCHTCDGLKAGPDVIATCYQVRQCNYSNVKKTSRQESLITRLTK